MPPTIIDFTKRVASLERRLSPPEGCDICQDWRRSVLVFVDEVTNEETRERPRACPDCGRILLFEREIVLVGVSRLEVVR